MKFSKLVLTSLVTLLATGCGSVSKSSENSVELSSVAVSNTTSESTISIEPSSSEEASLSSTQPSTASSKSSSNGPTKVTVPAHTLSDSNPPITIDGVGERVSKTTWESFRNAPNSKFNGNYNYTYSAYSGGVQTYEAFTKNGCYARSSSGKIYYERKSGNTFYSYIDVSDGWLREEITLDLQSKYTSRIVEEIYVHMFDYENYEYNEDDDGTYRYITTGFGCGVRFQNGYLTYLFYAVGSNIFQITASFDTTIDIPKSYYYQ